MMWDLADVKLLLECIVQAWPLRITLCVFPYEDQQQVFEPSGTVEEYIKHTWVYVSHDGTR